MKYQGIPVTTVARTLVDLTDILTSDELANVIHEAQYRERFSLEATQRAMERANGRKNLKRLEQAITDSLNGSAGTRSRNEREFLKLCEAHKAPEAAREHARPGHRSRLPLAATTTSSPRSTAPATPAAARKEKTEPSTRRSQASRLHDPARDPAGGPGGAPTRGGSAAVDRDLRLSRAQRERQGLRVRARTERVVRVDPLAELQRRPRRSRSARSTSAGSAARPTSRRCCTPCRCWRRYGRGPAAAAAGRTTR